MEIEPDQLTLKIKSLIKDLIEEDKFDISKINTPQEF